jgi:N-acetylglucosamine-6-phosphate deacetylase
MSVPRSALLADRLFDGEALHRGRAVIVEEGRIAAVLPSEDLPAGLDATSLPEGAWLAPGFIDLQVNGGGDVLLNDEPTPEAMARIAAAHRRFGTTGLLPTLITDRPEVMCAALDALPAGMALSPSVLGLHLEGPFLSPERPGVHDPASIRRPSDADRAVLSKARSGVLLVTLAPERVPGGFVAELARSGVRVFLGHTDATYEEANRALAEGATGFTHLFNAMRPLASREPGPIAAALESEAYAGLIADGVHVHPAMLRLASRGPTRAFLVTDAMPPVGGERGRFSLYGQPITVAGGRATRADGTLAGSVLDMGSAVRNAVRLVGLPLERALAMASLEPARAIGLDSHLGRIAPGYRADLVALDPKRIEVLATWVVGQSNGRELSDGRSVGASC